MIRIPSHPGHDYELARDAYGNKILLCANTHSRCPDLMTDGRVYLDSQLAAILAQKFSELAARLNGKRPSTLKLGTQLQRVLIAYRAGCRTLKEVEDNTGLNHSAVNTYTQRLIKSGFLERSGSDYRHAIRGHKPPAVYIAIFPLPEKARSANA